MTEPLSDTEIVIIRQIAAGWTNAEIAEALDYTEQHIKNTISLLYLKTGSRNHAHLVTYGFRNGYIPLPVSLLMAM